jgi:hypothetical protein
MIKQITLDEFITQISSGEKLKLVGEMEGSNFMSLTFRTWDKRNFIVHVSKVFEKIYED